ncbi:MAG: 1-deoxy-D-xylulose-5-phosphate reductoisomerase [Desulfobacula sp.]|jgi:1-deoxy-D-xylulose-5-phosphate reductoisomerase|uniref:1-deoxy-D-xylulose-5-phosphate reductoisomerase n=1 Tax=Desulfobacula sp. TaxID=2593537 RepID=UPI001D515EF0|nr:1-deoxy-D-xylulose-5-phosphate reductoisomerase [Desulfobacula sp.]MBT3484517.1 1-deoxy-D-xylulose-5-phosphate reductoisomerase [Desulfobacula sp.]MBT3803155.1 1-deoxy-D-xylulose-5-phosphate reductoisomerase [Desulfobacula sp.]MBT4024725.1 1-deoxy-D-xylulose-5-phosphate reductoisomerase [Desulfobacula sp.]MBT4197203.1 1-deoxy-D-xylulose-5-phosphate reductoisomerase [Desulfobacula sp.]
MKHLSILGSTGSIGTSALEIVRMYPDRFKVKALTAANNIDCLVGQIDEFKPELVAVLDETKALKLLKVLKGSCRPQILFGEAGYCEAASYGSSDLVLLAMVGAVGLKPALCAIESKKQIALANKETLVMAGEIVMAKALENNISILPVDSEHSAIFQCLKGNRKKELEIIFLTASGGPFRELPFDSFKDISLKDALRHPTWKMGNKITIDSATLMNKGLEIIEAVHLFEVNPEKIQVLVHPQSIVHSMVGYKDGSIMAQMGQPDMKAAIAYAMSEPERLDLQMDFPDFTTIGSLAFEKPDTQKFPSLLFAFEACKQKGTLPAVMNAANEVAVCAFLEKRIGFLDIFRLISSTMEHHTRIDNPDLSGIIEADCWAREKAQSLI